MTQSDVTLFKIDGERELHTDGFAIHLAWLPLGHGLHHTECFGIYCGRNRPGDFYIGEGAVLLNNKPYDTTPNLLLRLDILRKPLE